MRTKTQNTINTAMPARLFDELPPDFVFLLAPMAPVAVVLDGVVVLVDGVVFLGRILGHFK